MTAERFADAVKEYIAALQEMPDDLEAQNGQKQAEAKLLALTDKEKRQKAFDDLVDLRAPGPARQALHGCNRRAERRPSHQPGRPRGDPAAAAGGKGAEGGKGGKRPVAGPGEPRRRRRTAGRRQAACWRRPSRTCPRTPRRKRCSRTSIGWRRPRRRTRRPISRPSSRASWRWPPPGTPTPSRLTRRRWPQTRATICDSRWT